VAKAKLVFESGDREGEKVKIAEDEPLVIGRKEGTRLDLDEEGASYCHARIVRKGERYLLEDLHSEIGSLVNGESVMFSPLKDGDVIQIGGTRLVFRGGRTIAPPADAGKKAVAPHIELDRPAPKKMPHFDLPEHKVVKVKLKTARERAKEAEQNKTGNGENESPEQSEG
jgi:pSer/pThr/pTyr-binding forkhead associated (FHA) protein